MSTTRTKSRAAKTRGATAQRATPQRGFGLGSAVLVAAILSLVAWAAYSTSFGGVFVFDDQFAIAENPNIKALWPLTRSMSAPAEVPVSARPVASLTLAINYALAPSDARDVMAPGADDSSAAAFLRNVWGYHFMNLALHVLAALALFGVVRRTLLAERLRARLGGVSAVLAFVVALVWMVHPLTTDAVTYVTQRTEVLMGLFYFLTLYCAIRAGEESRPTVRWSEGPKVGPSNSPTFGRSDTRTLGPSDARGPRVWLWTAAAVVACALGMGSKQTMVTAPLIVVAWDWIFAGRGKVGGRDKLGGGGKLRAYEAEGEGGGKLRPYGRGMRWGLYAALAATWAIVVVGVVFERWPHSIGMDREGWTPWTYLLTQTGVIAHYLRLSIVPAPLVLDYDGWPMARSLLQVAPYAVLLAVLVAVTAFGLARRQPWSFAGAWFFALLVPSSSILPLASEIAAERRMYTALASIVVLVVIGTWLIGRWLLDRLIRDPRRRRSTGIVAACVLTGTIAITFGSLTSARNLDYRSDEGIWRDAVEKRPDNPRARLNYGVDLSRAGRDGEAEQQLREAVRLKETSAAAHGNLGALLCRQGHLEDGVSHLERAIALDPDYVAGYGNLGEAYGALGRRALAAKYFALAVDRDPDKPFLLNRLGWLLATSPEDEVRNGARAVDVAERAVRITAKQDLMSLDTLAAAYAEVGRFDDAIATAGQGLALANRQADRGMAAGLGQRLALYQTHQKFREPR